MRTLEKMSTRFPLQSPLFLLGLFLRRLVEGRSKCCSRACLFCLISPLAIAAAMAQNVTTAQVQPAHRAQTPQTAASRSSCHSPMVAAECFAMSIFNIRAGISEGWFCFRLSKHYMITVMSEQLSSSRGKILGHDGKNKSVHAWFHTCSNNLLMNYAKLTQTHVSYLHRDGFVHCL